MQLQEEFSPPEPSYLPPFQPYPAPSDRYIAPPLPTSPHHAPVYRAKETLYRGQLDPRAGAGADPLLVPLQLFPSPAYTVHTPCRATLTLG